MLCVPLVYAVPSTDLAVSSISALMAGLAERFESDGAFRNHGGVLPYLFRVPIGELVL